MQIDRRNLLSLGGLAFLAACGGGQPAVGPDGLPLPTVYDISEKDAAAIPYRVLNSINALRSAKGAPALMLNSSLNAAAATHSRDMSVQNRPWHFGSDGSSPIVRAQRAGYTGTVLGELISETYETEVETLSAWMKQADTRAILMDARATQMGFAWYQEPGGKLWWTLLTGT